MKKRSSKVVVALILAMTMLMGMSMTVMAAYQEEPEWRSVPVHGKTIRYITSAVGYNHGFEETSNEFHDFSCLECGPNGGWYSWMHGPSWWMTKSCDHLYEVSSSSHTHTHNYEWSTLVDPTTEQDGVEAYICSCGDIQATQPISAAHHILKVNADAVKNAKAGATVVVDLGRLNSLPRWFVTKLVERDDLNVTLKITYNHENYTLEVPKTATIEDESIEWYGPLKLMSMFPQK